MSFVAKTKSSAEWKLITNVVSTIVEEPSFEANAEGIQFRGMDPSHVAMIDLNWPNASFEKYECDKEFKLTLRIEELSKLIKRAKQNNSISISAEDDEYMIVKLENGRKREFQIRLIESSQSPQQVPKLSLDSKIVIDKGVFEDALNDVGVVADHITIETTNDEIKFIGNGERGKAEIILNKSDEGVHELSNPYVLICIKCENCDLKARKLIKREDFNKEKESVVGIMCETLKERGYKIVIAGKSSCEKSAFKITKEEWNCTYSLQYLSNILKAIGTTTETIDVGYTYEGPFKIEFKLGEVGGNINFYLAPRIVD